jgi:hydrogenase maturation factor
VGALVYVGSLTSVHEGAEGRLGSVSVRGARVEVALDLVPAAAVGDAVLVHAGVALTVVCEEPAETGGGA